jgi:hypothetical protein
MRVIWHPDAVEKLQVAGQWHDQTQSGLGDAFLNQFERTVRQMKADPQNSCKIRGENRKFTTHDFPYAILYAVVSFLFLWGCLASAAPPDYAPAIPGARLFPLRIIPETNHWWRNDTLTNSFSSSCRYEVADGSATLHLEVSCRSNAWTLEIQRGDVQYKPAFYSAYYGPGGGDIFKVFAGDLNGDGYADVVMAECNGGRSGLGAVFTDNLLLLSDGSGGFRLWDFNSANMSTNDFVALRPTAPCSVIVSQELQSEAPDKKTHSYWIFAPYEIRGGALNAVQNNEWPMWVWYKIKPNHEPTTHFTPFQQQQKWQAFLKEQRIVREILLERATAFPKAEAEGGLRRH